jgi:hypothetical protein
MPNLAPQVQYPLKKDPELLRLLLASLLQRVRRSQHQHPPRPPRQDPGPGPLFQQ